MVPRLREGVVASHHDMMAFLSFDILRIPCSVVIYPERFLDTKFLHAVPFAQSPFLHSGLL